VKFRVLGPLTVQAAGRALDLGSIRQRRLLAALLVSHNRVVSAADLIEVIWGENPPTTASRQLQNRIGALRIVLRRAATIIETHHAGYLLRVTPDEVDALRFDSLVEQGRAKGDRALLRRALGLWDGPALAGLDSGPLARAAAVLEERRLAALEDCLELELSAGDHERAVAELSVLVAENPMRERFVGQLMVALYRCGRTVEASAVYQELAQRLGDEFGIDPGADLRQLHDALQSGHHDRSGNPAATPGGTRLVPSQLPRDTYGFSGRAAEIDHLDRLLSERTAEPGVAISVIAGTAGVGKTALAIHWAHRVRNAFPDGQLYVNLRGYSSAPLLPPVEALSGLLRALGVEPEQVPTEIAEASALYRSVLADKRVLVLLDNAATVDQVRPLLPANSGNMVLVTSRDAMTGLVAKDGARRLTLDVLMPAEATVLLVNTLGTERVRAEPEAAAELARYCAHLPLALRIAAANLADHETISSYATKLTAGDRLAALQVEGDPEAAVRGAFDVSHASLPEPAQRMFRLLSLIPGTDFTVAAAAALADTGTDDARLQLNRLAAAHLIDQHTAGRYAFHDLLRLYAAEHATRQAPTERESAVQRVLGWYLGTASRAAELVYPQVVRLPAIESDARRLDFDGHSSALAWLDAERPNLIAAVRHAAEHGPRPAAWRLADALRGYFMRRAYTLDWLTVARTGLAAAEADGAILGQAAAHMSLSRAYNNQNRHREGIEHDARALAMHRQAGWLAGEAATHTGLCLAYWELGRLPEAVDHVTHALALNRQAGEVAGEAVCAGNLGALLQAMGRLTDALGSLSDAINLFQELRNPFGEAIATLNLGLTYHQLGRLTDALRELNHALHINRESGNQVGEAKTLESLAAVLRDMGDLDKAGDLALAALALETGDRRNDAECLCTLGTIHHRRGEYSTALDYHDQALRLARNAETPFPEALALIGLALAYQRLGRWDEAIARVREALALTRKIGYRVFEGRALTALAGIHLERDDRDAAMITAKLALAVHRATGHRLGETDTLAILDAAEVASAAG
jgi:DNA-binding SARP family transcriptional activator/Flp pilus assembly protein TadD